MKALLVGTLIFATAWAGAQTKMRVVMGGKDAGTASLTQRLREDGSKLVQLSMTMKQGDREVTLRSESIYASNGMPIRKYLEVSVPSQKYRRTRIATFDAKGANLTEDLNGTRSTKQIPLDPKANRANASEFWFLREQPKKGAKVSFHNFSMETLDWSLADATYQGLAELTIGGKKLSLHKTTAVGGAIYSDKAGEPVRMEFPGGFLERAGA